MGFQYVKIFYGPYTSFHTTSHKPQRVRGVRDKLRKLGYRVDLIPVDYHNYCLFEMFGHEIFRCNIQNLQFNTESDLDSVSMRAVDACLAASERFERARSYFWFWSILEESVFKRSEYAPKDHWPFEVEIKKYASCLECVNCCGILTKNAGKEDKKKFDYHKTKQEIIFAP